MLKEGPKEVWALVFRQQRVSGFLGQVIPILGDDLAISLSLVCLQPCSTTLSAGAYAGKNSASIMRSATSLA
jgi:hypothetical protein